MSESPEPLGNLVQSIHLTHASPQGLDKFILSTFPAKAGEGSLTLYGSNDEGEVGVWEGSLTDAKVSKAGPVLFYNIVIAQTSVLNSSW